MNLFHEIANEPRAIMKHIYEILQEHNFFQTLSNTHIIISRRKSFDPDN